MKYAIPKLPPTLINIVNTACNTPEGSYWKNGKVYFDNIVNMGWKMYIGNVFRPIYQITNLKRSLLSIQPTQNYSIFVLVINLQVL